MAELNPSPTTTSLLPWPVPTLTETTPSPSRPLPSQMIVASTLPHSTQLTGAPTMSQSRWRTRTLLPTWMSLPLWVKT